MSLDPDRRPRIILGVTASRSLGLMRGFPQHLVELGWDVHVVSSGPAADTDGATHHVIEMRRDPHPFYDLRALIHWVRLIRRLRPDVVSTGTPKAGMLGMVAAWVGRVPVRVYKLRGLRLETSHGLRRKLFAGIERLTMACANTVLAVSHSLRDRSVELGLGARAKFTVLGKGSSNGVDLERFESVEYGSALREGLGLAEGQVLIGFVGRLGRDKGILELCDAVRILYTRGLPFHVVLIGSVEDQTCCGAVQELVADGLPATMVGRVDDTAQWYRALDILCLPTHREGFPNVVLEAGASSLPTVTTRATGAVDSVVDGETGLLVGVGDGEQLADALATLVRDPSLREQMGQLAREHVERHYSRGRLWELEDALYRECLRDGIQ